MTMRWTAILIGVLMVSPGLAWPQTEWLMTPPIR